MRPPAFEVSTGREPRKIAKIIDEMRLVVIAGPFDDIAPVDIGRAGDLVQGALKARDSKMQLWPKANMLAENGYELFPAQAGLFRHAGDGHTTRAGEGLKRV